MRKIYNSPELQKKIKQFNSTLFDDRTFTKPRELLRRMLMIPDKMNKFDMPAVLVNAYIRKIRTEYQRILCAGPEEMKVLIAEFDRIIHHKAMTSKFSEALVTAMRYLDLRDKEFLVLAEDMGLKNCIYCHAQLTIIVVDAYYINADLRRGVQPGDPRSRRGLMQLDHRYPKSQFPFLCTSFYNLYPTCSYCNNVKSKKYSDFDLYASQNELEVFKFSLDPASLAKYMTNWNAQDLKIQINPIGQTEKKGKVYLEMFDIQEIYDTQKDLAEELIHKRVAYTHPYKKRLVTDFKALFPDPKILDRLIIGNYSKVEDVLKRPMAKFVQDIAVDIKLIKR
ncbi:hypothetical protein D3C87_219380 [compost metagenome]